MVQSNPPDTANGEQFLLDALGRSREIEFVEEELPALRALATIEFKRGNLDRSREYLSESWNLSERGDFRLYHADSLNILARLEFASNDRQKGAATAIKAYETSICDGLPFSYQRGLDDAAEILNKFGFAVPPVKFCGPASISMTASEIDPVDEFNAKYAT